MPQANNANKLIPELLWGDVTILPTNIFSTSIDDILNLNWVLSYSINLSSAIKKLIKRGFTSLDIANMSSDQDWFSAQILEILEDKILTENEYQMLFWDNTRLNYKEFLSYRVSQAGIPISWKHSNYLYDLINKWKIHNYIFLWEWWHGQALLTFDYSTTPTTLSVVKLSKHKEEGPHIKWDFIEEAYIQRRFFNFYTWYKQHSSMTHIRVPELYNWGHSLTSIPEQWKLVMEYTNAETIETLLVLSEYYDKFFKNIKSIISKYHGRDNYIISEIVVKLENMGVDYIKASENLILRLLTKKDLLEILKLEWINIPNEKIYKHQVKKTHWEKAILKITALNNFTVQNIEWLTSDVMKAYHDFLSSAEKQWLKHIDLNSSNIMLDVKDGRIFVWIIDYGATEEV